MDEFAAWLVEAPVSSRNKDLVFGRLTGRTYRDLGEAFGLSAGRAQQIYKGVERRFLTRNARAERLAALKEKQANWDVHLRREAERLGLFATPIDDLDVSVRTRNCAKDVGMTSAAELLLAPDDDLLAIPNFGRKSLNEVKELRDLYLAPA